MKTRINIDDRILREAAKLTGATEKTALVRLGLETLVSLESAKRLASLGGTEKCMRLIPRRRSHEPEQRASRHALFVRHSEHKST